MRLRYTIATLFIFISIVFISSCSTDSSEKNEKKSLEKKELSTRIDSLTAGLSVPMSNAEAKKLSLDLMRSCNKYVEDFPKDEHCADYLFISARAAKGLGQYDKSLKTLNKIKKAYRDFDKMPEVYFLYAFILDEDLDRKEEAKKAYTDLINTFPDDQLSEQAVVLLDQLYMSDEEIIEMWELNN